MTLSNMRQLGVQRLVATYLNDVCRRQGFIDASTYQAGTEVPWFWSQGDVREMQARGC
jgi:hypothetical protein